MSKKERFKSVVREWFLNKMNFVIDDKRLDDLYDKVNKSEVTCRDLKVTGLIALPKDTFKD